MTDAPTITHPRALIIHFITIKILLPLGAMVAQLGLWPFRIALRLNCFDWKNPNCCALVNVKLKCQRYVLFLRWRHYRIMQQLYSTPPTHHLNGSAAIPKSQRQWSIGCGPEQQRNHSTTSTHHSWMWIESELFDFCFWNVKQNVQRYYWSSSNMYLWWMVVYKIK